MLCLRVYGTAREKNGFWHLKYMQEYGHVDFNILARK